MTVMERFEAPTDRAAFAGRRATVGPPIDRRPFGFAAIEVATNEVATAEIAATDSAAVPPGTDETSASGWDGDAIVVPTAGYGGLLALGAVAGTTAAAVFGAVVGWTGPVVTFAALVGLDVGVLVGAGVGGLVARRHRRAVETGSPSEARRRTRRHGIAADPVH